MIRIEFAVLNVEERHDYNRGKVWNKVHDRTVVGSMTAAVKVASAFRKLGTGSDVVIVETSRRDDATVVASCVRQHHRFVPTMRGTGAYWKTMTIRNDDRDALAFCALGVK